MSFPYQTNPFRRWTHLFIALGLILTLLGAGFAQTSGSLGSKDPGLFNLKGTIYFLDENSEGMPADLAQRNPQGVIYTDRLDVPERDFTDGFPGLTTRFEWFGLVYTGTFQITIPGGYKWRLSSDDGSRLWIDGKEVINNDGIHAVQDGQAETKLAAGLHAIKVWYFQGPPQSIALRLFITPPGAEEKIFSMADYSAGLAEAVKKVHAEITPDGIRVKMDAALLFETGKYDLKAGARETIQAVAEMLRAYPGCTVRVEGHTDSMGEDAFNLKLSEARAKAVKEALVAAKTPTGIKFATQGFGKSRPDASNDAESGRAQNRRVEIYIKP